MSPSRGPGGLQSEINRVATVHAKHGRQTAMHFSIVLLEWKTLPIDGQIAIFLHGSQTVCGSFDVLRLQKVISDCGEIQENSNFVLPICRAFFCAIQTLQHFETGHLTEERKSGCVLSIC